MPHVLNSQSNWSTWRYALIPRDLAANWLGLCIHDGDPSAAWLLTASIHNHTISLSLKGGGLRPLLSEHPPHVFPSLVTGGGGWWREEMCSQLAIVLVMSTHHSNQNPNHLHLGSSVLCMATAIESDLRLTSIQLQMNKFLVTIPRLFPIVTHSCFLSTSDDGTSYCGRLTQQQVGAYASQNNYIAYNPECRKQAPKLSMWREFPTGDIDCLSQNVSTSWENGNVNGRR